MRKTVLIVDDDQGVLYTVKNGLEGMDTQFTVVCAYTGEECLERLNKQKAPDLILLDVMMPEMNGWEVFKRIRSNPDFVKIPIVFLTATADDTSKITGELMADDFIEKPFKLTDLKKRIDVLLEK